MGRSLLVFSGGLPMHPAVRAALPLMVHQAVLVLVHDGRSHIPTTRAPVIRLILFSYPVMGCKNSLLFHTALPARWCAVFARETVHQAPTRWFGRMNPSNPSGLRPFCTCQIPSFSRVLPAFHTPHYIPRTCDESNPPRGFPVLLAGGGRSLSAGRKFAFLLPPSPPWRIVAGL